MADVKISQLPAATTPLDGTEVLPIVQSATTKQVSIANVTAGRAMAASSLTLTTPLAVTSGGTGLSTTAAGTLLSSTALNTVSATATPTLGVAGTTAGTLTLSGGTSGTVTLKTALAAGTNTIFQFPATNGTNNYILTTNGSGVTDWTNPTALGIDLDVGTTAITGGTTGRVLYDNGGFLGEYTVTGTAGNVVLSTSPTLATPTFTTSFTSPLHIGGTTASSSLTLQSTSGVGTSDSILLKVGNNGATTAATVDTLGNIALSSATFSPTQTAGGSMAMTGTLAMGSSFKRNRIINGNMQIWQRGTSGSSGFSADRWLAENTTSFSQQTDVPSGQGFQYSVQFANTAASYPLISQKIESVNCTDLAGQKVTISFWAKNNSGSAILYSEIYYANAADNFSSKTLIEANTVSSSPSSSWTKYTWTTTNVLPSQAANGLYITIVRNNGSVATTTVTGVQLEVGSVATPYERQIYSDQLAQCQRYLPYFSYASGSNPYFGAGMVTSLSSSTTAWFTVQFPVTPRVPPTGMVVSAASHFSAFLPSTATSNATGTTFAGANSLGANFNLTGLSGTTAGYSTLCFMNSASAVMYFTGCEL